MQVAPREAAVLIPLFDASSATSATAEPSSSSSSSPDSNVHVALTLRATALTAHAGEVACAGGKRDASDASLEATALREAHEEVRCCCSCLLLLALMLLLLPPPPLLHCVRSASRQRR